MAFLQMPRSPATPRRFYLLRDIHCRYGRSVTALNSEKINKAILDLYQRKRLSNNYFGNIKLHVSTGKNVALLHNMLNFRICRSDIADKIAAVAGPIVQMIPVKLYEDDQSVVDNYVIINPLSEAHVDIEHTDAKWWDGKVGGDIQHWYSLALRAETISSPIFRIAESPEQVVIDECVKSIFEHNEMGGVSLEGVSVR